MRSSPRNRTRNTYALAPSPRHVPTSTGLSVLFGGTLNQVGWIVFGAGMIFVWMMFPVEEWVWQAAAGDGVQTTTGVVTDSDETNASVNDASVYYVSYRFQGPDGVEYEDYSYATGRGRRVGSKEKIEYIRNRPYISRIAGMRRSTFGLLASVVALFPLVGLGLVWPGLRKGIKARRLLRDGRPALAELAGNEPTSMSINDRPVHKLTYTFTADDGNPYPIVVKTHEVEEFCTGQFKRALYDPGNPGCAILLADLFDGLKIDGAGNLQPVGMLNLITVLFMPAVSVVGNGYYFYGTYILS